MIDIDKENKDIKNDHVVIDISKSNDTNDIIHNNLLNSEEKKTIEVNSDNNQIKENKENYFNFTFYKVDPKWRWLNEIGKDESATEFLELLKAANTKMRVKTYSTIGLRHDSEFMIWTISSSLENIQIFTSKIYSTILGKYIEPSNTFLSLTKKSIYSNQTKAGFEREDEPSLKYLIVYPFIKSRDWYLLPIDTRKQMMDEHIRVGKKYPDIRRNTTYSFGIGDQDFMLAFETDDLSRFQNLIMDLRETQLSKYILKDLPMIPCTLKNMDEIVKSLG
ncbi:MAG TPA: chlorite dismutase family protein [Candidatus Nitrosocosmicus sp.]